MAPSLIPVSHSPALCSFHSCGPTDDKVAFPEGPDGGNFHNNGLANPPSSSFPSLSLQMLASHWLSLPLLFIPTFSSLPFK